MNFLQSTGDLGQLVSLWTATLSILLSVCVCVSASATKKCHASLESVLVCLQAAETHILSIASLPGERICQEGRGGKRVSYDFQKLYPIMLL